MFTFDDFEQSGTFLVQKSWFFSSSFELPRICDRSRSEHENSCFSQSTSYISIFSEHFAIFLGLCERMHTEFVTRMPPLPELRNQWWLPWFDARCIQWESNTIFAKVNEVSKPATPQSVFSSDHTPYQKGSSASSCAKGSLAKAITPILQLISLHRSLQPEQFSSRWLGALSLFN